MTTRGPQLQCTNLQQVVLVVGRRAELANGTRDDAGKLGVHRYVRIVLDDLPDDLELRLEIGRPHLARDIIDRST